LGHLQFLGDAVMGYLLSTLARTFGVAAGTRVGQAHRLRDRALRAERELQQLRYELQAERYAATHDPLTGLLNRRAFFAAGEGLLATSSERSLTCVLVDLNGFKAINDTLGHLVGDEVLIVTAQRFADFAGDCPIARLGGDEFAGLLFGASEGKDRTAKDLGAILATPIEAGGTIMSVTASIGIAEVTAPCHLTEALSRADHIMYRAKNANKTASRRREANPRNSTPHPSALPIVAVHAVQMPETRA
jgi:diguanylate cyclase (GGDEF)-like protein